MRSLFVNYITQLDNLIVLFSNYATELKDLLLLFHSL